VINLPSTLLLFLIKERVLSKFISNTVDFFSGKGKGFILIPDLAESYFEWESTKEGHKYWEDLINKYYEQYDE
jgi:hypothetical protein